MISNKKKQYFELLAELLDNESRALSVRDRYVFLKKFLERCSFQITKESTLQFPSLFSRLTYISQKFKLDKNLSWNLQNIRIKYNFLMKNNQYIISEKQYSIALKTIEVFLATIFEEEMFDKENIAKDSVLKNINKNDYLRIQIIEVDTNKHILTAIEQSKNKQIHIKYGIPKINNEFTNVLDNIWIDAQLNIIDYKIDELDFYIPKIFVLEPDYLIDASALAECFQNFGHSYLHYFRRRFETNSNSKHILLGNLANSFLDELIFSKDSKKETFENKFIEAFRQKPFEFTSCKDIKEKSAFVEFMTRSKNQFGNIRRTINHDFVLNGIDTNKCTLEPSFFCEKYGFQGRLDLLQIADDNLQIIELKSGSLPYPKNDPTRISINHEVQTAIYQLIASSVYKNKNIVAAILYSAANNINENIRYAAPYKGLNKDIINVRNEIVATEHKLYTGNSEDAKSLLDSICNINNYGKVPNFFSEQINSLTKTITSLSNLEKAYLYRYITFISRDLYIHKVGGSSYESYASIADLWNTNFADRLESFNIINNLEIDNIDESSKDLKITLKRIYSTDFVNFREGELCVLYPQDNPDDTVLTNQIMKGYIDKISEKYIVLRFRYKQKNKKYFEIHKSWVIEHDYLDHTYNYMYKNLFSFFKAPQHKREIILGYKNPSNHEKPYLYDNKNTDKHTIEERKENIIRKAILADNYFLLIGPPGTGKTSQYARQLVSHYHNNTTDAILLIAYTNRAVDELCESICSSFNSDYNLCKDYIRIGTEISCDERYGHRLLQNIASEVKNRDELNNIIKKNRIFVGTLTSILGKPELFTLKNFNVAIIDEASQILEPQIIGLLPLVEKFIMIGDHKQLSTITLQDNTKSIVTEPILNTIKLTDCKESLFERLFRVCEKNYWTDNYDTLLYQGRMHIDIEKYPNKFFYNGILKPINKWQSEPLKYNIHEYTNVYSNIIAKKRTFFIDTSDTLSSILTDKINYKEAEIAIELCKAVIDIHELNHIPFETQKSIGIITPYRNQIALIKHKISKEEEKYRSLLSDIMIDTIERYQGSQRDIIIVSFCINKAYQLDLFCNWDRDKLVDRKLNVAITRARKQLLLIGNKNILSKIPIYKDLIESIL